MVTGQSQGRVLMDRAGLGQHLQDQPAGRPSWLPGARPGHVAAGWPGQRLQAVLEGPGGG